MFLIRNYTEGNLLDKITDHLTNFLIIKNIKNNHKTKKIKIRDMKNFDHDKYLSDFEKLDNFNWLEFEDIDEVFMPTKINSLR